MTDYHKQEYVRKADVRVQTPRIMDYCRQEFIPLRRKPDVLDKAAKTMFCLSTSYLLYHVGAAYFR